jgi:hypothetical protein
MRQYLASYQSIDKYPQVIFQTAYTSHTTHFAHLGQLTRLLWFSMCLNHFSTGYVGIVLLAETSILSSNGWLHFPIPFRPHYVPEPGSFLLFVPSCIFLHQAIFYILNSWFSSGTRCFPFNINIYLRSTS